MGWLYIIVRTFPFWAVPLSAAMIAAWFRNGKRPAHDKVSIWWAIIGFSMLSLSAAFLAFQGHFTAVPFIYEVIVSPRG